MRTKCTKILTLLMVFVSAMTIAQIQVSGVVKDAEGEPLPEAYVESESGASTEADINGRYTITANQGEKLTFSFVGMDDVVKTVFGSSLNVTLGGSDGNEIEQVVVTGAFNIRKDPRAVAYSTAEISEDQLLENAEPDILRSVSDKVPGADLKISTGVAGAANKIILRGSKSFTGNNQPLLVVDGIPYSNTEISEGSSERSLDGPSVASGISTLDPNDIKSIKFLKGNTAAALYGGRAFDGVILVETKSGSKGSSKRGLEVNLASTTSFETIAQLPDYQNTYGAGADGIYSNSNGSWGPRFDSLESIPVWDEFYDAGVITSPTIPYVAQPENVKDLFRTGVIRDNSISIRANGEKAGFNTVVSRLDQESYIPNNDLNRTSFSVGGWGKLDNGLSINGKGTYSLMNQRSPLLGNNQFEGGASSFARTLWINRTWDTSLPFEDKDGMPLAWNGSNQYDNPKWSWKHNGYDIETERTLMNIGLGYDLNDWITTNYQFGYNAYNLNQLKIVDIGSRDADVAGVGQLSRTHYSRDEVESTLTVNFNKDFAEHFNANVTLGHNVNQITRTHDRTVGTGMIAPGIYNLKNTKKQVVKRDDYYRERLWGVFADASISYKDWLFLNMTARNDWYSALPEDNRSIFYPGVSSSFIFTDAFDLKSSVLTYGKIRGGWARVGNARVLDSYDVLSIFYNNTYNSQSAYFIENTLTDPDIKAEMNDEWELGLDLEFFKRRVVLDFTYYHNKSKDLLTSVPPAPSSGYERYKNNLGEVENKGLEIGLTIVPVKTKNFEWSTFTSFTKNENEVTSLNGANQFQLNVNEVSSIIEGQPYGVFYGTQYARDDEGSLLVNPADGQYIVDNVEGIIGNPNPDFKVGFTNEFRYKNWKLKAVWTWKEGGDVYSNSITSLLGRGVTRDTENRERAVVIPGVYGNPNTLEPILDANGNRTQNTTVVTVNDLYFGNTFAINSADEAKVYDGTVYRLKEVGISYSVPKEWLDNTFLGSMTFSIFGENIWYHAPNVPKHTNFDPDVSSLGTSNALGIEQSAPPSPKRWGFNVRVSF